MSLVVLDRETLAYGRREVLTGVSLALAPGERVVLLGKSGSGKTTLLNAVYDRLEVDGRRIALVPQDSALVPQLTCEKNVLMGRLDDRGIFRNVMSFMRTPGADRLEIAALLDEVGLGHEARSAVEALSGGQRQRAAVARAFFRGGEVLIGDEPVSALDRAQAADLLERMKARFSTALLALHDTELARSFATRLVGIRGGAVQFDAAPEAVSEGALDELYA